MASADKGVWSIAMDDKAAEITKHCEEEHPDYERYVINVHKNDGWFDIGNLKSLVESQFDANGTVYNDEKMDYLLNIFEESNKDDSTYEGSSSEENESHTTSLDDMTQTLQTMLRFAMTYSHRDCIPRPGIALFSTDSWVPGIFVRH